MKKIFFSALAALILIGCKDAQNQPTQGFQEGQKVALVCEQPNADSQNSPRRINGTRTENTLNFTWEATDKIIVKVGDKSSEFHLQSGAGAASATFLGAMPASGNKFDVVFAGKALNEQIYTANCPDAKAMRFEANNVEWDNTKDEPTAVSLQPSYAVMCVALTGSEKVGSIVVTNPSNSKEYKLTCSTPVQLSATATNFYIVVEQGTYKARVDIKAENGSTFETLYTTQTFTVGATHNMETKNIAAATTGVENGHAWVQLWKDGPKWSTCRIGATETKADKDGTFFYWGGTSSSNTYGSTNPPSKYKINNDYMQLELSDDAARQTWGGTWRIPTKAEWDALKTNCTWTWNYSTSDYKQCYYLVQGKGDYTDNSIKLYYTGFKTSSASSINWYNYRGQYLSSTKTKDKIEFYTISFYAASASTFYTISSSPSVTSTNGRTSLYQILPVCD